MISGTLRAALVATLMFAAAPLAAASCPSIITDTPADGAKNVAQPVTFHWTAVTGASQYTVYYSVGTSTTDLVLFTTTKNSGAATVPAGTIRWRVKTTTPSCDMESAWATFTAAQAAPVTPACMPPALTQPSNATITAGEAATLTVTATGTAPIAVTWYRGNPGDRTSPVGSGNSIIVTPPATTTYWASGSNSCGSASTNAVTVAVQPATPSCTPPSINQPSDRTITAGQSATLTVTATGTAPITIAWYRGNPGDRTSPAGTGSSITVAPAATTTYWVSAANDCGTAVSGAVSVIVTAVAPPPPPPTCVAPSIVSTSPDASINRGQSITLSVNATGTDPLAYAWYEGSSGDKSRTAGSNSPQLITPMLESTTSYWVEVSNSCGRAASSAIVISVAAPNCVPLISPVVSAVSQVTIGQRFTLRWNPVSGADHYEIEESLTEDFSSLFLTRFVDGLEASFSYVTATTRFYRVRAESSCANPGPYSAAVRVQINPVVIRGHEASLSTELGANTAVDFTMDLAASRPADATVTTDAPWLNASFADATSSTVNLQTNPSGLTAGTHTATVLTKSPSGAVYAAGQVSITIATPVSPSTASISSEGLIIPAVTHTERGGATWITDARITNIAPIALDYRVIFRPTSGMAAKPFQTIVNVPAGNTIALDDVLANWFGAGPSNDASGTIEIDPLDSAIRQTGKPVRLTTIAASRTYNRTQNNGTYGQFIPAMPIAQVAASRTQTLSLTSLAQNENYRTNVGFVETAGAWTDLLVKLFDENGSALGVLPLRLAPNQHMQINSMLAHLNIASENARAEIVVTSAAGAVIPYASVVDNQTNAPAFVSAVAHSDSGDSTRIVPEALAMNAADGTWRTDLRLFNSSTSVATARVEFIASGSNTPVATHEITVGAASQTNIADAVRSLFALDSVAGAIRVTSTSGVPIMTNARTYHHSASGTYGQLVSSFANANAVSANEAPVHLIAIEQSERYRTDAGIVEVSGKAARVRVTAIVPGGKTAASTVIDLQPNELHRFGSILESFGYAHAYNARISFQVVGGEGSIAAYGSLVDLRTNDPTFIAAQ